MIFKVYYQEIKKRNPKRETTKSLYVESESNVTVLELMEKNTPYNVEYVQVLEGNHLVYEQEHTNFSLTEF